MIRNALLYLLLSLCTMAAGCTAGLEPLAAEAPPGHNMTLQARMGGPALSVAVDGQSLYLGQSFELAIFDRTQPLAPQQVAVLPLSVNEIVAADALLYVGTRDGIAVVDAAVPAHAHVVAQRALRGTTTALSLHDDTLFAADARTLYRFDVTEPATPRLTGALALDDRIHGVTLDGDRAYVATQQGLHVVTGDADGLRVLASLATAAWQQRAVRVADHLFMVGGAGLTVVDVSAPAAPRMAGTLELPGLSSDITVRDDIAFIANSSGGLVTVDVRDPARPVLMDRLALEGTAWTLAQDGDLLYVADLTRGGVHVVNTAGALGLFEAGVIRRPATTWSVGLSAEHAYVVAGKVGEIFALETRDAASPAVVDSMALPAEISALTMDQSCMVLTGAHDAVYLVGTNDVARMTPANVMSLGAGVDGVVLLEPYAYVATADAFLSVLDYTDMAAPLVGAVLSLPGPAGAMAAQGDQLVVATKTGDLLVIDISTRAYPQIRGRVQTGIEARALALEGATAYLVGADSRLLALDLEEPSTPHVLTDAPLPYTVHDMAVADGVLFLAADRAGVRAVRLHQGALVDVGHYDTPDIARELAVRDGMIYVADTYGGLLVLEFTPGGEGED